MFLSNYMECLEKKHTLHCAKHIWLRRKVWHKGAIGTLKESLMIYFCELWGKLWLSTHMLVKCFLSHLKQNGEPSPTVALKGPTWDWTVPVWNHFATISVIVSIAEKCFNIWAIMKMASENSVKLGNNVFWINRIITFRSKLLPLRFSKFVLVLIF